MWNEPFLEMTTMFARSILALVVCSALALVFLEPTPGRTQQEGRVPNAPEALTRGPVHEAYLQPGNSQLQPPAPILREPPKQVEEQPPDQKPEGAVVWVPGYWQWDDDRSDFIWVSGFWRVPPPGRQWLPGFYRQVENGYQWVPGMWTGENQAQLNLVPTPPASIENGPSQPAPADNSVYLPGSWVYRDARYLWRPGYYTSYRPDYVWVPARYVSTPAGYVFVDGYWDYPLGRRGLLFAPVAFPDGSASQPGYVFTPSEVVNADFLPSALFVRPAYGQYYYGDYFGPSFVAAGYTPWIDFNLYRNTPDPLFVQSRIGFGGAGWDRNMHTLYAQRAAGVGVLPPRSLAQQRTMIRSQAPNSGSVRNVTVVSPLAQASSQGVRLAPVPVNERVRYQQNSQQVRQRAVPRRDLERQPATSNTANVRASDPRTVTLKVQHPAITAPPQAPTTRATPVPVGHGNPAAVGHEVHTASAHVPVIQSAPHAAAGHRASPPPPRGSSHSKPPRK